MRLRLVVRVKRKRENGVDRARSLGSQTTTIVCDCHSPQKIYVWPTRTIAFLEICQAKM